MTKIMETKHGEKYIIIERIGDVTTIEFQDDHKHRQECSSSVMRNNGMKNPFTRSVCGVGYMGSGEYKTKVDGKHTPQYAVWNSMMKRCYSEVTHGYRPTYLEMSVCDEWHNFQVFAKWYDKQYIGDRWQLDKDILKKGNGVYCPEYCRFVPRDINVALTLRKRDRGDLPVGVLKNSNGTYAARCSNNTGKQVNLGTFQTVDEAFGAYQCAKKKHLRDLADGYKDLICPMVYDSLYNWEVSFDD